MRLSQGRTSRVLSREFLVTTTGVSSFSATRVQPSLVVGSHVRLQMLPAFWSQGVQGKTLRLQACSQAVECCCCSWVFLSTGWQGGSLVFCFCYWNSVRCFECSAGMLQRHHWRHLVGELEQLEDPINALDMLMWIEQSEEVAESICVNEDPVCRRFTEGRD